jgi:hypothetical protein
MLALLFPLVSCSNNQRFLYRFYDMDHSTILKECFDISGTIITAPSDPEPFQKEGKSYVFSSWYGFQEGMILHSDIDFYAMYTSEDIKYTYRFLDGNSILKEETVQYGELIVPPENNPSKPSDDLYSYKFTSWSNYQQDMVITHDIDFVAQYTKYAINVTELVNSTNSSEVHLGKGNFGTIAFNHNSSVSTVTTAFCNDYYAKLYNDIPDTSEKAVEMVAYHRELDFTFIGSDEYGNSDPSLAHQTILDGLDVYGGAFYNKLTKAIVHSDPLGLAKKCEGADYSDFYQWMETVDVKNITIKNCSFKDKYGARFALGLAGQSYNVSSEYGTINNVTFENCSFINLQKRENDYINSSVSAIDINALDSRQKGTITIKNCLFDDICYEEADLETSDANATAVHTNGFHNASITGNIFNKCAHNAIGISGGGGISGYVNISNNKISNTLSRAIRLHSSNCALLNSNNAVLKIANNEFHNIGLNEEPNCFIKASLGNTNFPLPYTFEEGDDHRFELVDNKYYLQNSDVPLTLIEMNAGTKNCDIHSGTSESTYLDGVYINA